MQNRQFDYERWRKRILEIRDAKTHKEAIEFCELVDRVSDMNHAEVTRTLFQTLTDKPDHGVKESVYNELGAVDAQLYYQVYLEELPALIKNTQRTKWYVLLASYPGGELTAEEWDRVISLMRKMPQETRKAFMDIISTDDFILDNDWAEAVLEKLQQPEHRSR